MRSYLVKENPIGSAVSEILRYKQPDKQTDRHRSTLYYRLSCPLRNLIWWKNADYVYVYQFQYGFETDYIRVIRTEPVHRQTGKSYIVSNFRQFSTNIKMEIIDVIRVLLARVSPRG